MATAARRWMVLALALAWLSAAAAISSVPLSVSPPAVGAPHTVRAEARGLDRCQAPSHDQMRAFWHDTRWWMWAIYIGGSNMACANRNVTENWIDTEVRRGWALLPIWVGPQPPCTPYQDRFSSDPQQAFDRGRQVAGNAAGHAVNELDLNSRVPIVYDLEAFNTQNDTCLRATKAFVRGWVTRLHRDPPKPAGLYGSVCGSGLRAFWNISPNPDFIWGAQWESPPDPDVRHMSCVDSDMWAGHRHKQYRGDVSVTENGVTLRVDVNCSRGPAYGNSDTPTADACGG